MSFFKPGAVLRPLLLAALMLALAACASRVNTAYRAPIDADTIEKATNSMAFDVQDFHWSYMRDGRGLKVVGLIKNNTGETQRRALVYALLFDEKGIGTAMGEAQVSPTVLKPGAVGKFTLVAATSRPKDGEPLRHLRLLTNTQASATK